MIGWKSKRHQLINNVGLKLSLVRPGELKAQLLMGGCCWQSRASLTFSFPGKVRGLITWSSHFFGWLLTLNESLQSCQVDSDLSIHWTTRVWWRFHTPHIPHPNSKVEQRQRQHWKSNRHTFCCRPAKKEESFKSPHMPPRVSITATPGAMVNTFLLQLPLNLTNWEQHKA